ncbi:uncharacterized protein LOC106165944 isoform X1 [Lingula anatina]|uniref:Uncharacterized protein LOC106165944 isoform X1 n=1 Tax=Lingula anatina TaxID=7574 RepID=A0A1S3IPD1_LINAN|nr:uncharacterized protein LOC106165944 isoform X1 [Lingula anatina]|eukprot:XP_013399766.1 uncharacterized protein LOC106165944 isoform X1 [Lingula anatina]
MKPLKVILSLLYFAVLIHDATCARACIEPTLEHGRITNPANYYLNGSTIHIVPNVGYFLDGDSIATCDVDHGWINLPTIKAAVCPEPILENGQITNPADEYINGYTIHIVANDGYFLDGEAVSFLDGESRADSTCDAVHNQWINLPTIKVLPCDEPLSFANGEIVTQEPYVRNQTVLAQCAPGYVAENGLQNVNVTCYINGTWDPMPICSALQDLSATYRCGVNPNEVIMIVKNNNNYQDAYIPGYKDDGSCQPDFSMMPGGWTHVAFRLAEGTCGMVTTPNGLKTWSVLATYSLVIEQHTDVEFTTDPGCNFTAEETEFVELTSVRVQNISRGGDTIIQGTGPSLSTFQQGVANIGRETVTMVMKKASGGSDTKSCYLGEEVLLAMTLTESDTAWGIKVYRCIVKPTRDSPNNETFVLLNDKGCPDDRQFINAPFHGQLRQAQTVKSGSFRCFKFPEKETLYFNCEIGFCTSQHKRCFQGPVDICQRDERTKRWVTKEDMHFAIGLQVSVTQNPGGNVLSNNEEKMTVGPKSRMSTIFTVSTIAVVCLILTAGIIIIIVIPLRKCRILPAIKNRCSNTAISGSLL